MSAKTVEKRRKRSWSSYLTLHKGTYKAWVTPDVALLHSQQNEDTIYFPRKAPQRRSYSAKGKLAVRCYGISGVAYTPALWGELDSRRPKA
ncbi:hypothetical protein TNCV_4345831 [Trichonephila clavipes]|nr:hypothetical protein TNCV_4345831 [Trichonephila clavipes]